MRAPELRWQHGCVQLRCVIVDDDDAFLAVMQRLLEREGVTVAGTAQTRTGAIECARTLQPEVMLVDIHLGEESGFETAKLLAAEERATVLIMISSYPETDYADLIAESPAIGFLAKGDISADAINRLLRTA
jgi:DNA-binding NarL/FixJ family response regulator